eukprot:UN30489
MEKLDVKMRSERTHTIHFTDSSRNIVPHNKEQCCGCLHHPKAFCCRSIDILCTRFVLFTFWAGSIYGVIAFILYWVGFDTLGLYTGVILLLVGAIGAYEMRTMGGMMLQIRLLAGIIDKLAEHTGAVEVHVNDIGVQNKELSK